MDQFPPKLKLPTYVNQTRVQREKSLLLSASYGIAIRFTVVLFELVGVWFFGSAALLLDAVASLVDIGSSLLLLLFIKLASRPPDTNHPFGHGRYEPLIGLQLGIMLVCIGIYAGIRQIFHVSDPISAELIDPRTFIFPLVAMVLLEICYRILSHTAKAQNSPALVADAFHYRVDAITSMFATIALILAAIIPAWGHVADHIGAIAISGFMIVTGFFASKENVNQLLDHTPDNSYFERVKKAAHLVQGVLGTEKIRIQSYGPDSHVDIDIEVEPKLSVEVAHKISQEVRLEIQKEWPMVRDVTVHIEPYYPNDH